MYASAVCSGKVTPGGKKKNRTKKSMGGPAGEKRDIRKVEHMTGKNENKFVDKRKKAMGGGMMKKYSVGGGLDMGGPKGKIMQSIKNKKKNSERLTRRDKQFLEDNAKGIPTKAYMGGGMMKKYSTGGDSKLKDDTFKPIFKKSEGAKKELAFEQIDSALSQKNIGSGGMSRRGLMKVVDAAADDKQLERSLRKRLRDAPTKENKKMGGGMMNKPMGYKSGKSIKVKCKLGKNKPTKLY
jgi:hypothetical protein